MTETAAAVRVKSLSFAYDSSPEKTVLSGIDFSLEPKTITAVIGLSGCGKSTLCRILSGIIPQCILGTVSGEVLIGGEEIANQPLSVLSQKVGYVMQDPDRQIIASTVEDELAFGPENLMLPPEEIRERADKVMKQLGLEKLALRNPLSLSGGEKQLVAAAAVLTMEPDILIMDEPMSNVDQEGRRKMTELMKSLRESGKTVIVVEHDYELLDFADSWMVMENGKIKAFASPDRLLKEGVV